jgi:hypothetical protein
MQEEILLSSLFQKASIVSTLRKFYEGHRKEEKKKGQDRGVAGSWCSIRYTKCLREGGA